ncbi:MAG: hypothetical protein EAZ24_02935 [Burkholderiales bacterium]|nr:MAG: hypothetical protein EAZ21_11150 [Betaproteobacteria bacterium]TAG83494.1 MAG: hypothetical protein EAZ24_02935 [Burkholderiales bacterium]
MQAKNSCLRARASTLLLSAALVLSALFVVPQSAAQSPSAPALYAASTEGLPALKFRGGGLLRMFGFQIYNSFLWTPGGEAFDPKKPFALDIQYLRNFEGRKLAERSIDEMRGQGVGNDTVYPKWLAEMTRVFPDVKPEDRLTGVFTSERTARFFHNGRFTGEVKDAEFAAAFFGIWLSENTSQPRLRERMLGLK